MFAAVGEPFRFYMACAVMLVLSFFAAYLCVHGFLTDQAPSIGRYPRPFWFSRVAHPEKFWVSIIFHALLGAVLLFSPLLLVYYCHRPRGNVYPFVQAGRLRRPLTQPFGRGVRKSVSSGTWGSVVFD